MGGSTLFETRIRDLGETDSHRGRVPAFLHAFEINDGPTVADAEFVERRIQMLLFLACAGHHFCHGAWNDSGLKLLCLQLRVRTTPTRRIGERGSGRSRQSRSSARMRKMADLVSGNRTSGP